MNHKHRKILQAIFAHPVSANIAFKDVVSVFEELGAEIDNKHGNRIGVKLGGHSVAFSHAGHDLPPAPSSRDVDPHPRASRRDWHFPASPTVAIWLVTQGWVAEWLKAAVLKCSRCRPGPSYRVPLREAFRRFRGGTFEASTPSVPPRHHPSGANSGANLIRP